MPPEVAFAEDEIDAHQDEIEGHTATEVDNTIRFSELSATQTSARRRRRRTAQGTGQKPAKPARAKALKARVKKLEARVKELEATEAQVKELEATVERLVPLLPTTTTTTTTTFMPYNRGVACGSKRDNYETKAAGEKCWFIHPHNGQLQEGLCHQPMKSKMNGKVKEWRVVGNPYCIVGRTLPDGAREKACKDKPDGSKCMYAIEAATNRPERNATGFCNKDLSTGHVYCKETPDSYPAVKACTKDGKKKGDFCTFPGVQAKDSMGVCATLTLSGKEHLMCQQVKVEVRACQHKKGEEKCLYHAWRAGSRREFQGKCKKLPTTLPGGVRKTVFQCIVTPR
jgi:hypothetical protein